MDTTRPNFDFLCQSGYNNARILFDGIEFNMGLHNVPDLPEGNANSRIPYLSSSFNGGIRPVLAALGADMRREIQCAHYHHHENNDPRRVADIVAAIDVFADKQVTENSGLWCLKMRAAINSQTAIVQNDIDHGYINVAADVQQSSLVKPETYTFAHDLPEGHVDDLASFIEERGDQWIPLPQLLRLLPRENLIPDGVKSMRKASEIVETIPRLGQMTYLDDLLSRGGYRGDEPL